LVSASSKMIDNHCTCNITSLYS